MSKYTMDQYTLQSYFKSLCNSFYIAYEKVKRLEKLEEELESTCPEEELEMVKGYLQNYERYPKSIVQNYIKIEYERLEEIKKTLELDLQEYNEKYEEVNEPIRFWSQFLWEDAKKIARMLEIIKKNDFSVIVTSKKDIIALMAYFREHSVEEYRIINADEQCLKSFPTGKKMYEEFLAAYRSENDDEMKKVIEKYF